MSYDRQYYLSRPGIQNPRLVAKRERLQREREQRIKRISDYGRRNFNTSEPEMAHSDFERTNDHLRAVVQVARDQDT